MSSHEFPVVLTDDDHKRVERKLAELRESDDGSGSISVFFPGARQVLMLLARDGDIVSWCLMPARDEGRAHKLTVLLTQVLRRELGFVCRDVKALADAAIGRAARAAGRQAQLEARRRRNDTYPGEWDCGVQ
ncbi:MAG: hypothetical protein JWO70_4405 [Betaproteobacteria bacterium]|nr:hypothetical protein [Betaproteobacteria bacterium]